MSTENIKTTAATHCWTMTHTRAHDGLVTLYDLVQVGDLVRSHDFPDLLRGWGGTDHADLGDDRFLPGLRPNPNFVEGRVLAIVPRHGIDYYEIECERRLSDGRECVSSKGNIYYAPVNGTPSTRGRVTWCVQVDQQDRERRAAAAADALLEIL